MENKIEELEKIGTEEVEKEMNGSARSRVQLFAIRIEHMTGKLVNEK